MNPLAPSTTCLHCNERFDGGVEIIGRPNARMESLIHKLGEHMARKHPHIMQAMQIDGAAYIGMLFLTNFRSTDETLNLERDKQRWAVHQRTLNARFTDESLKEHAAELARRFVLICDEDNTNGVHVDTTQRNITDMLIEAVTGIRDVLEEPNRYSEVKAEQKAS